MKDRIRFEFLRRWGRVDGKFSEISSDILQKKTFVEVVLPVVMLQLLLYLMSIVMGVNKGYDVIFLIQCMLTVFLIWISVRAGSSKKMVMTVVALISIGIFVQHLLASEISGYEDGAISFLFHVICGVVSFTITIQVFNKGYKLTSFFLSDKGFCVLTTISVICYLLCFVSGRINGASNWIIIGGISIQGTEICKLIYYWVLGAVVNRPKFEKYGERILVFFAVNAVCLALNSELGYMLIISVVTLIMLIICTENFEELIRSMKTPGIIMIMLMIAGCVAVICTMNFGSESGFIWGAIDKIKGRVLGFLYPQQYPDTYGYQSEMISVALFNGGFFGSDKETILPVAESDMIFAVTVAKLGLIFGLAIIMLYILFLVLGTKIAYEKKNSFCMTFVIGIFIQALYNIAAVIGVVPIAGVPLYFVSAGGSAMVCAMAMTAVIISVSGEKYKMCDEEVENNEKTKSEESNDHSNMPDDISGNNTGCENGINTGNITGS